MGDLMPGGVRALRVAVERFEHAYRKLSAQHDRVAADEIAGLGAEAIERAFSWMPTWRDDESGPPGGEATVISLGDVRSWLNEACSETP